MADSLYVTSGYGTQLKLATSSLVRISTEEVCPTEANHACPLITRFLSGRSASRPAIQEVQLISAAA